MPNQIEYSEDYETQLVRKNLDNLCKFLTKLNNDDDWENPHRYTITENKYDGYPKEYELLNLKIDSIEDGVVIFDDGEGILEENIDYFKLHHIQVDNIIMINDNGSEISISTGYVYIRIKY